MLFADWLILKNIGKVPLEKVLCMVFNDMVDVAVFFVYFDWYILTAWR